MGPVPRIKRRFEIGADENKTEDFGESRELIGEISRLHSLGLFSPHHRTRQFPTSGPQGRAPSGYALGLRCRDTPCGPWHSQAACGRRICGRRNAGLAGIASALHFTANREWNSEHQIVSSQKSVLMRFPPETDAQTLDVTLSERYGARATLFRSTG